MRCSEVARAGCGRALRALVGGALVLTCGLAAAHKASDAYLQIATAPGQLDVRWDIALRDLDVALDLDSDGDGKLTWGEVRAAWPRIEAYALQRLAIDGCALAPAGRGLERRNDGAYAALMLRSPCTLSTAPRISYGLFADVDPTHRGIVKVERAGQAVALSVLEPIAAMPGMAWSAGAAVAIASSPVGASSADASPRPSASDGRWEFLREGVRHILTGYDHVLFLLCLLLPSVLRRTPSGWQPVERLSQAVWPVVGIVSAFTVAHSITLGLAAMKVVSLSPAFIEPAIAATIVLAALDNVVPIFPVRRAVVAFGFGLIHGFGFAGVLAELNLARADFAWALLQFNLGLEAGQLVIVAVATSALFGLRRWRGYPRFVIGVGSAIAIAIGTVWLIERTASVSILPF
ncbi:MAG: HupE/UreJ family protein [Caldimonas sp.]